MRLVMKFGGTAVDSSDKVRHIAQLVLSHKKGNEIVCVVSAVRGMTDGLLSIADSVKRGDKASLDEFVKKCTNTHMQIAEGAISDKKLKSEALATVKKIIRELEDVLGGIVLLGEVTAKSLDYLMSFGERLSTPIVSFALQDLGMKSEYLTGKEVGILTDSNFGEARPLMDTTKLKVNHQLEPMLKQDVVPVVTGFIGADQYGNITTIGRGGSDYTATIIAVSIGAGEVWLWSDVDGLMTADPKLVTNARVLKEVSFAEAMEMALFGAKYMHPRALEPVVDSKIPIRIRNTFNVSHSGTIITQNPSKESQKIVKSVSVIRHTALIDVSGGGMVGAPGTAAKIFGAVAKHDINVIMITQGSSELNLAFVVNDRDCEQAARALHEEFELGGIG